MYRPFQERVAEVDALLIQTRTARDAFYAQFPRRAPPKPLRFQVVFKGEAFRIVDLVNGQSRAALVSYEDAVDFAKLLEDKAARQA